MRLAQWPQRSDAGEVRTRRPLVSSQALYHWATALPALVIAKFKYLHFDPLGGGQRGGVDFWHCHAYLQALGNHGWVWEVVKYNSFEEMWR